MEYRQAIEQIRALQRAGDIQAARVLLDRMVADGAGNTENAQHGPEPLTVLGLPRRLHATLLRQAKLERDPVARAGYRFTMVPPPALLAPYAQLSTTQKRVWNASNREPVPHHIHQIWIGPRALPASVAAWRSHAALRGYDYTLWGEDALRKAGIYEDAVFRDRLERGDYPGAVDVARYVLLERFGGIYLDCDWFPARDDVGFDDFLPMRGLTAMAEDVPRDLGASGSVLLYNSFIAAPPEHPVFRRIIEAMPEVARLMPGAPAWWATGPLIFTVAARAGAVCLADPALIAGSFPDGTPGTEIDAFRAAPDAPAGLLLAWKSWADSSEG